MRGIAALVLATVVGLVPISAHAQPVDPPRLSPREPEVSEAAGSVVLTLSKETPGRVVYATRNGSCTTPSSGQQGWCRPSAHAPDDYGAVSGQVTFTAAGSREITISIVDDELDEGMEFFEVEAHELTDTGGWAGSSTAIVRIIDDESPCWFPPCALDGSGAAAADAATATPTSAVRPSTSPAPSTPEPPVSTGPPPASPSTPGPAPVEDVAGPAPASPEVAGSGELPPTPGFALPSGDSPGPVPEARAGGRVQPGVALGIGTAAVAAVGAAARFRRRRRN